MDEQRKELDPELVCTCNDLYVDDIQDALRLGEREYKDIFSIHEMAPRCCGCIDHVLQLRRDWESE
ncbi:MAG: (2Fe-2S)-binding protein [Marinobacterium sp.]|nr:(2Fe-2S)-binding protein [Marinobacterium sp.]